MSFDAVESPGDQTTVGPEWDLLRRQDSCPSSPVGSSCPIAESAGVPPHLRRGDPVWVWGVPLARLTLAEAVAAVGGLIAAGRPSYFITAPTHYAMLTEQAPDLRAINAGAAFIVADGAPLVWASRWSGSPMPLPERVAGS